MARPLLLGLLAAALAGCSLLTDFGDECSGAGECGAGLACVQGLCVAGEAREDLGGGMGGAPGDAGVDAAPPGVLVLPETCDSLRGVAPEDAFDDDVVLLGLLMPSTGALGEVGPPIRDAAFLALDEINQSGGAAGRRFALLSCDTATSVEAATAMARFMVETAKVPAIIGPAASSATLAVANQVAIPNGVVLVSPSSTSPAITDLPDDGLVWRTAPSDAIQGAAIAAHLLAGDFEKVAVVNRDDTYGNGLRDAIQRDLCAADRCGEAVYYSRSYGEDDVQGMSRILFDLQDFEPDVVVLIAFVEDGIQFLSLAGDAGLNDFILTDGTRDPALLAMVEHPMLLARVLGTAPASPSGALFEQFSLRYRNKWQKVPGVFNAQAYDAMYVLGYAVAGIPSGDAVTGAAIARQLGRVSAGEAIEAGADRWNRGVSILQGDAEATIDFVGASGPLDFGPEGEATGDIEAWRFNVETGRVDTLGTLYTADGEYMAPAGSAK
ncbi:MAG: ABC transporter substrate-binding protein [Myxococcales bacterium]|nr:ABC transporter substrate-binding protein [Myxococcales bacterium]